jgi:hypothetical protein
MRPPIRRTMLALSIALAFSRKMAKRQVNHLAQVAA